VKRPKIKGEIAERIQAKGTRVADTVTREGKAERKPNPARRERPSRMPPAPPAGV
jgi:hypothetical protein